MDIKKQTSAAGAALVCKEQCLSNQTRYKKIRVFHNQGRPLRTAFKNHSLSSGL